MTDEVRRYLRKAEHALEVAEDLLKDGHVPDAASKTSYAMYYAAQALLNADGIDVVKHSAIEAAFGYHFVKTGKIEAKFHRMLMNARKIRELADYDIDEGIVEPAASLKIDEGRAFLSVIKDYLGL
jgi:uncharacterized protein (UPF0332 family)